MALASFLAAGCALPPSPMPSATPRPTPTLPSGDEPFFPAEPPFAVLNVAGGEPVAGELGTWAFRGGGSSAPWLQGARVVVPPAGGLARVFLSEPLVIASWSARVAPAGRAPQPGEAREIGSGVGPIEIHLPSGAWTMQISVQFGDGDGDAAWYWLLGQ